MWGLAWWSSGWDSVFQCRGSGFNPWSGSWDPTCHAARKPKHKTEAKTWVCAKSLQSCLTLCDLMNQSPPGSSVHGFSRQKYWNGLPCTPPGDLPDPGIEPLSPALAGGFFTISATWEAPVMKNLPAIQEAQETWVWSLGQENPMEKEKATRSSILAWKIPWMEEPGGLYWVTEHTRAA